MKKVAKLILLDEDGNYLLMCRSNHPTFGNDPDLPGGTWEEGESVLETVIREVQEEIGVSVDKASIKTYSGVDYSRHGTHYALFISTVNIQPEISMSWEHSSYEWLEYEEFLTRAKNAKDTYMHMVHDTVRKMHEVWL